ncbi:MAG: hypothetical protein ACRYGI_05415 [Janthinobacterium lividum]
MATEAEVHAGLAEMFHRRSGNDTVDRTPTISVDQGAGQGSLERMTIIGAGRQSNRVERRRHGDDLAELVRARAA